MVTPKRITLGALLAFAAICLFWLQPTFHGWFPPVGIGQAALALVASGVVAVRWRWGALAAPVLSILLVALDWPFIVGDLAHPAEDFNDFAFTVVALLLLGVASVGGIATAWHRRGDARPVKGRTDA